MKLNVDLIGSTSSAIIETNVMILYCRSCHTMSEDIEMLSNGSTLLIGGSVKIGDNIAVVTI